MPAATLGICSQQGTHHTPLQCAAMSVVLHVHFMYRWQTKSCTTMKQQAISFYFSYLLSNC